MPVPTPGASNGPGVLGFVADTKFTPNRGFFSNAFSLSITTVTAGAEIWFTLNGNVPAPAATGCRALHELAYDLEHHDGSRRRFPDKLRPGTCGHAHVPLYRERGIAAGEPDRISGDMVRRWHQPIHGMDPNIVTNAAAGYEHHELTALVARHQPRGADG